MAYTSKELAHYGVKGMKWGVTRADISAAGKRTKKAVNAVGRGSKKALVKTAKAAGKTAKWAAKNPDIALGAVIAANILVAYGRYGLGMGSAHIAMKAAKNRQRAGFAAARGIAQKASDVPYAKLSRGVYNVTTLK